MQGWYLGWEKVSCLGEVSSVQECPYRGVLIDILFTYCHYSLWLRRQDGVQEGQ